eukprot:4929279-Pyramimonas_sp.AAC.1
MLGYLAGPLPGEWTSKDPISPLRPELAAAIWPMAWCLQSPLCPLPVHMYTDNMDALRVHGGRYVQGALFATKSLLDLSLIHI